MAPTEIFLKAFFQKPIFFHVYKDARQKPTPGYRKVLELSFVAYSNKDYRLVTDWAEFNKYIIS